MFRCLYFAFRWSYGIVLYEIFTFGKWNFWNVCGRQRVFLTPILLLRGCQLTYPNLGEKTISVLGTSSFGGQESIQKRWQTIPVKMTSIDQVTIGSQSGNVSICRAQPPMRPSLLLEKHGINVKPWRWFQLWFSIKFSFGRNSPLNLREMKWISLKVQLVCRIKKEALLTFVIFVGNYPYSEMKGLEVHKYVSDGHRLERSSRVSLELYVKSNLIIHTRR